MARCTGARRLRSSCGFPARPRPSSRASTATRWRSKGRAGAALTIAAVGSYVAGTVSVVALMLLAPPLAAFALRFGPPEYTALLVLGLLALGYMSGGSIPKALAMAVLGLLLGMIGIDPMTGFFRFAYGVVELGDGIGIVPVAVGLFGSGRDPHHRRPDRRARSGPAAPAPAPALVRGVAAVVGADRTRHRPGFPGRHHPRLGPHPLELRLVRGRAAAGGAAGGVRHGRGRGGGGAGVGEQRRHLGGLRPDARAGSPVRAPSPP